MAQAAPTTKIDEPIPAIVRVGRPVKNTNGMVPSMPKDLLPGVWTPQAEKVLAERYLQKNDNGEVIETPDQMCWRVAWDIASVETDPEFFARKFYSLMVAHEFLPNSPTLMNAGKNNGLQYNGCFVIPVEDSIEGIFDGIKFTAIIHKSGGGTGFSFSRLRQSGARVGSTKGVASGPVSFMKIYDAATEQIKQGGSRRGANMGVLHVDHPDILEFIHCKESGGITNFNISVAVTDIFMKAYYEGTTYDLLDPKTKKVVGSLDAGKVMEEIVDGAWKTGDPGMIFIDRINAGSANPVPSLGPIETTNPCVTGDALISTGNGLIRMKDLVKAEKEIELVIDERASEKGTRGKAIKFFDNGIKEVFKVVTKAGLELTVTSDHKLLTPDGWKETQNLKNGDKIFIQNQEGCFGKDEKWTKELGQIVGWLVGDGWVRSGDENCRVGFTFGKEDSINMEYIKKHINKLYGKEINEVERVRNTYHLSYHGKDFVDFFLKLGVKAVKAGEKEVPESIYTASREAVVGFLQGLFTADGTIGIQETNNTRYIRLTSKSKLLLNGVQLLLLNLGIYSHIYNRSRKLRTGMFAYKTTGGEIHTYDLDGVLYELQVSRDQIPLFLKKVSFLGDKHKNKIKMLTAYKKYYKTSYEEEIQEIVPMGKQNVYDLTEQKSYTFIANGVVSYDCGEQPLYSYDACNLGSIFLTYFVNNGQIEWEKLEGVVKLSVRFLDNVIERNPLPLEKIQHTVNKIRRIGLGIGGWADMLVKMGIAYDSQEAIDLAEKVMKFINEKGHEASQELAMERGAFPLWPESIYKNDKPIRNCTVTTIAPTGTIGHIAGTSQGVEPFFGIAFKHYVKTNAMERSLYYLNPLFEKEAEGQSWYTDAVKEKIAQEGTVSHIEEVPQNLRRLFRTAHDIAPEWHVKTQAAFQKYTDNAVSKTINLSNNATPEDIKQAYVQAYEWGCNGITVYRDGCKDVQVLNLGTKEKTVVIEEPKLKPRPVMVDGATYRIETPMGTAFITVNHDVERNPFEVFISVGKAGSEVAAMAEALGRLISTTLRFGNHLPAKERAREIVDQLAGIGGSGSVGFGKERVRSLPDAVAKAITMHFSLNSPDLPVKEATEKEISSFKFQIENLSAVKRDLCPSCGAAAFVFEEGCSKCYACGFSKC